MTTVERARSAFSSARARSGYKRVLYDLESSILNPTTEQDLAAVRVLFHPDYLEMGSSGRVYRRSDVLEMLSVQTPDAGVVIRDFEVHKIIDNAALVTYRSIGISGQEARRSSVWVNRDGRWKIQFHQGTRVPNSWGAVS